MYWIKGSVFVGMFTDTQTFEVDTTAFKNNIPFQFETK